MDAQTVDVIKVLSDAPIYIVLIYLLIRESNKVQQLMTSMIEMEQRHAADLVELACHGLIRRDNPEK